MHGESLETPLLAVQPLSAMKLENAMDAIEPGQDYEVVVDFFPSSPLELEKFYKELEAIGTSIQLGEGEGMYRLHIHVTTEKRYQPIDYILSLGTVTKVAMENLLDQMKKEGAAPAGDHSGLAVIEPGQIAVVAVSPGPGISRVFASLGVAAIVEGGQTMNPSTQEILNAFENLPTEKIIILPNNKNIILSAQAAKEVTVKKVHIVPSRTIPQGLAAMLQLNPDGNIEDVAGKMTRSLDEVITGEITIATRSVEIDGVSVEKDQVIALMDGKLVFSASSLDEACLGMLEKAHASDYELITMFFGQDLNHAEANRIADLVREKYPGQEIEIQNGGQPHYQFIISVE